MHREKHGVQGLAQGYFGMQVGGARDQITDPLISR